MSLLTREGRITFKPFASVTALAGLPELRQQPGPLTLPTKASDLLYLDYSLIDLAEGCMLTKSVKYTHELMHWVGPARNEDPTEVVSGG